MAETSETKLQAFKDDFNKEAERLLREYFPKKIVELNELLHSDMFQVKDLSEISRRSIMADCSSDGCSSLDCSSPSKRKKLEQLVDGPGY
jgi:hypothetical protein